MPSQMWFMVKPPEKVSHDEVLRDAIKTGTVSLKTAYSAQVEIHQLKEVVDELDDEEQKKEIHH